jgi:CHASE3 domain sensor protein
MIIYTLCDGNNYDFLARYVSTSTAHIDTLFIVLIIIIIIIIIIFIILLITRAAMINYRR